MTLKKAEIFTLKVWKLRFKIHRTIIEINFNYRTLFMMRRVRKMRKNNWDCHFHRCIDALSKWQKHENSTFFFVSTKINFHFSRWWWWCRTRSKKNKCMFIDIIKWKIKVPHIKFISSLSLSRPRTRLGSAFFFSSSLLKVSRLVSLSFTRCSRSSRRNSCFPLVRVARWEQRKTENM